MSLSKMPHREIRAFVNGSRVATGVLLKGGNFLQTYPLKQTWGHESSWRQVVLLQQKGKDVLFLYGDRNTAMKQAHASLCLKKRAENWLNLFEHHEKILAALPPDYKAKVETYLASGDAKVLA